MEELTGRVIRYWTARAHDFAAVRRNELEDGISGRWIGTIDAYLPQGRSLDILDAGTGSGFFAILLAKKGHAVTGIDLTQAMIAEAEKLAAENGAAPRFLMADAQATGFGDGSFDAVVSRNLTWTLPEPEKAYREWYRVLRPGGVLLNFDADYARNVRDHNQKESYLREKGVYGHIGITPELSRENAEITLSVPASAHARPAWDILLAQAAGFAEVSADAQAGRRILGERDLADAPLFLLQARK